MPLCSYAAIGYAVRYLGDHAIMPLWGHAVMHPGDYAVRLRSEVVPLQLPAAWTPLGHRVHTADVPLV